VSEDYYALFALYGGIDGARGIYRMRYYSFPIKRLLLFVLLSI
jgi:hypothetical protein